MGRTLEAWSRDFFHALRSLRRAPGFTLVTVATLALAIGSNTAIFSVVRTVLLDPLAFPDPDRLVAIAASAPGSDLPDEFGVSSEFWVQYREQAEGLEELGMYRSGQTTVRTDDHIERLFITQATASLFTTLGATPVLGRLPTEEDQPDVALISYWLWQSWFGGDDAVIGRSIEVSGDMRSIIGVMGPDFRFPEDRIAVWFPGVLGDQITPGQFGANLVGRMTPGTDHATLLAQLAPLASRLPERFGGSAQYMRIIEQHRPIVRSLEEELVGDVAGPLWVLFGTVGIILLIACANVANLLLVRAESRRQDLAVRRALGSGRGGLVRYQMSEALILAGLGAAGGAALAWIGVPLLVSAAPESIPRLETVRLDMTALLFTLGLAFVAAVAAGLLPAIRFSNPDFMGLRHGARIESGRDHRTRDVLVVVQTAAALVLLVGSGLLVQSFRELSRVDPGYETRDIFTFQMAPNYSDHGVSDAPSLARFHYEFLDRLAALPGVESVGLVNTLPLDEGAGLTRFATDLTDAGIEEERLVRFTFTGGDYFETMGISLLSGRLFERNDRVGGEVYALVSQSAADLFWPGEQPLGRRLRRASDAEGWVTVVGVVEDVLLEDFRQAAPEPLVYLPMVGHTPRSWGVGTPAYVVKSSRASSIAAEIRTLIRDVAPSAPMYRIFTMQQLADRSLAQLTFTMLTLGIAAALALILAAVGLYGVLSYVVSLRTREIGIRMALGAQAGEVRRMVVAQGGRVTLLGVVIGVAAALMLTRSLESLLFGVEAISVPVFIAMSSLMLTVALLASYIPARRASSADPMRTLRSD